VQIQPPGVGLLRAADSTFYGQLDDDVIVANVETRRAIRLTGPARDIWLEIVRHGGVEPAVEALARLYDADSGLLRSDVTALLGDFCRRGLLVDHGAGDDDAS
jgi:hypothetical protein